MFHNHTLLDSVRIPRVVAATGVTWDPANKCPTITLSNGNLTAIVSGAAAAAQDNIRNTVSHTNVTAGLYYAEFTSIVPSGFSGVGLVEAAFVIDTGGTGAGAAAGFTNNSIIYFASGSVYQNSVEVLNLGTYATGDVISMALSQTQRMVWFRKNGGFWNGHSDADPTGTDWGQDVSNIINAYAALQIGQTDGDGFTANFGQSAYLFSKPAGYVNW